jgi:hypothetical protein
LNVFAVASEEKELSEVLLGVDDTSAEEVVLLWREGDYPAAEEYTLAVVLIGKFGDLVSVGIDVAHVPYFTLAAQLM